MMMPADAFYRSFASAFARAAVDAGLARQGRRGAKWRRVVAGHEMRLAFAVVRRAAGIPDAPGEFRPEISWQGPKGGARDEGTVSYYQYATDADMAEVQSLRRAVVQKVVAGAQSNKLLSVIAESLDTPWRSHHPDVALYYFDEDDAAAWGGWFGERMRGWLDRFEAAPETLESYCWRVVWRKP